MRAILSGTCAGGETRSGRVGREPRRPEFAETATAVNVQRTASSCTVDCCLVRTSLNLESVNHEGNVAFLARTALTTIDHVGGPETGLASTTGRPRQDSRLLRVSRCPLPDGAGYVSEFAKRTTKLHCVAFGLAAFRMVLSQTTAAATLSPESARL